MAKNNTEISVEEKLRALYDLQLIDSRIDELRNTRGELPNEVNDLDAEIQGMNKRQEKIQGDMDQLQSQINIKNEAIHQSKNLIEKYTAQQDQVRNNKEFDNLAKEIEYQELEIQLAEKKIREFNAQSEHKKEILDKLSERISEQSKHLEAKKSELDSLIAETENEENYLTERSKEFSEKIDERTLKSYRRIRDNSPNGLAVVGIERGAPKGSFFTIPPQKQMEIAQRKKLIIDEHSGKILVDDELVMEENEKMQEILHFRS